jgi:hypothetical protein
VPALLRAAARQAHDSFLIFGRGASLTIIAGAVVDTAIICGGKAVALEPMPQGNPAAPRHRRPAGRVRMSLAIVSGLGLVAWPALRGAADEAHLNVNPGLWEVTTVSQTSGQMPVPEEMLAKMSPEQRARIQEAMKQVMERAREPRVFKECITAQQIRDGLRKAMMDRESCKRTVVSSSATLLEMHEECTGRQQSTGTYRFEAPDPGTMHGTIDMVMTRGTHAMNVKGHIDGKWLSADCGNVKPGSTEME